VQGVEKNEKKEKYTAFVALLLRIYEFKHLIFIRTLLGGLEEI
ncbi:31953_t:CDS:2, partial [Racocetra persica]